MNYGIIVDAFSTGARLAKELHERSQVSLIHIRSDKSFPTDHLEIYEKSLFAYDVSLADYTSVSDLVDYLKGFGDIKFCTAGTESGVILAADLSRLLELKNSNSLEVAESCRYKDKMVAKLKRGSLRYINSILTDSAPEIIRWKLINAYKAVVLKPISAAASIDVNFCFTDRDIEQTMAKLLHKKDIFGDEINKVLVQELIYGEQYIVNVLSSRGEHHITDVWFDKRSEHSGVNYVGDYEELIYEDDSNYAEIVRYTYSVLDAFDIKFGATFIEIIIDERTDSPVLIEIAGRLKGIMDDTILRDTFKESQLSLFASLLTDEDEFLRRIKLKTKSEDHIMLVMLQAHHSKEIVDNKFADTVVTLPTFYNAIKLPLLGDMVTPMQNFLSTAGAVYLKSECRERIMADYDKIRKSERTLL